VSVRRKARALGINHVALEVVDTKAWFRISRWISRHRLIQRGALAVLHPMIRKKLDRKSVASVSFTLLTLLVATVAHAGDDTIAGSSDPKILMKQAALYMHGQGADADPAAAIALYRRVAEQDVAFAQYKLARLYLDGEVVARDIQQAHVWLHRAAGLGFVEAQMTLSRLYESGSDVETDYVSAYKWLHIADSLTEDDIEERRQALEAKMSFLQVTRAKYLARRCIYRGYRDC